MKQQDDLALQISITAIVTHLHVTLTRSHLAASSLLFGVYRLPFMINLGNIYLSFINRQIFII